MKLVVISHAFSPSIGGVETVSRIVSEQLTELGHEVTVVTTTPAGDAAERYSYTVLRNPDGPQLRRLFNSVDAVIESHITLGLSWPIYLGKLIGRVGIPWPLARLRLVSVMHTPEMKPGYALTRANRLKLFLLRRTAPYAVSEYLLRSQGVNGRLMPNPYDDKIFKKIDVERASMNHLLFVGRLTAAKGCDVAIEALALLNSRPGVQQAYHLDVVGSGEDEASLRVQANSLGQDAFVHFLGAKKGHDLAEIFNAHRIVLMPSRSTPPEAFGLVALEAAACGCTLIGSNQGGLPEAIGPCGVVFPEGDAVGLAEAILKMDLRKVEELTENAREEHLSRHAPAIVAQSYLAAIGQN